MSAPRQQLERYATALGLLVRPAGGPRNALMVRVASGPAGHRRPFCVSVGYECLSPRPGAAARSGAPERST